MTGRKAETRHGERNAPPYTNGAPAECWTCFHSFCSPGCGTAMRRSKAHPRFLRSLTQIESHAGHDVRPVLEEDASKHPVVEPRSVASHECLPNHRTQTEADECPNAEPRSVAECWTCGMFEGRSCKCGGTFTRPLGKGQWACIGCGAWYEAGPANTPLPLDATRAAQHRVGGHDVRKPIEHGPGRFPRWNSAESEELMERHISSRCLCGRDFTSVPDYNAHIKHEQAIQRLKEAGGSIHERRSVCPLP